MARAAEDFGADVDLFTFLWAGSATSGCPAMEVRLVLSASPMLLAGRRRTL